MNSKWNWTKLSVFLKRSGTLEIPEPAKLYRQIGIQLWGKGAYQRDEIYGKDTAYSHFSAVREGDVVINKIWARNGAVAVVGSEHDGFYVSTEFPVFTTDINLCDPYWFSLATKQKWFWAACNDKAFGTSGKNRIKPEKFLEIEIPLPPIPEQEWMLNQIQNVQISSDSIKKLRRNQYSEIRQLIFSHFVDITEDCNRLPFSQIAPINRRPVEIEPETAYHEIGARSFGKGLFDKPSFKGKDLTWQQPYWIHTGDLVFSNIKAWEGAVAAAGDSAHLKVASHRYLTYTPDKNFTSAEFLCYYFLTPEGLEILGKASPGSADRNRTLNTRFLNNIMIPIPSPEIQGEFLEFKNKMEMVQKHHASTLKELEELFPSLLNKAFKGEL